MIGPDVVDFSQDFDARIKNAMRFCYFTRAIELQTKQIGKVEKLLTEVEILKNREIDAANEDAANYLLSLECVAKATLAELQMYIFLKTDQMGKAWDSLVDAQSEAQAAVKAHPKASPMDGVLKRLSLLERAFFPKPMFCSPSFTVRTSKCSICGEKYGDCGHIKGRPYMGKFCAEIIEKVDKLREVSMVDNPANRHARVIAYGEGKSKFDVLTLRRIPSDQDLNVQA